MVHGTTLIQISSPKDTNVLMFVQSPAQAQHEADDTSSAKKPRVVWSVEMHQQFVNAVNSLGIDSEHLLFILLAPSPGHVPFCLHACHFSMSPDGLASNFLIASLIGTIPYCAW